MPTTIIAITVYGDTLVTQMELDQRLPCDRSPIGIHGTEDQCGGQIGMGRISTMYNVLECNACNLRVHFPMHGSQSVRALIGQSKRRNYRTTGSSGLARSKLPPET